MQIAAEDRVIVFGADGSRFYESARCSGDVFVPQGSFVELVDASGDVLSVTVK